MIAHSPNALALLALLVLGGCRQLPGGVGEPLVPGRETPDHFTFTYQPPPGSPAIHTIAVAGTFNDWSTGMLPMARLMDGSWQATARLEPGGLGPGRHEYKFLINGSWPADMCHDSTWGDPQRQFWIDPDADGCVPDGHEGRNAVLDLGAAGPDDGPGFHHDPNDPAHLSVAAGRLSVRFHAGEGRVRAASLAVEGRRIPMELQLSHRSRQTWRASLPEGARSYGIHIETTGGVREVGPFQVPGSLFRGVDWVGGAVGYQIFPERFWNGDRGNDHHAMATDAWHLMHPRHRGEPPVLMPSWGGEVMPFHCCHQYFGGDLQGIIDRLGHLDSLGVSLLYLNPVSAAGSAHGYDTFDYLQVAPNLGDEATLRRLLERARTRGMRVMWDFVPNHVGVGHHAFQDAVRNGPSSQYWRWFRFHVPADRVEVGNGRHYDAWWGFGSLPKLDTANPEVFAYLLEVTRHWTAFGFDGIRVDVPNEITNRKEFFGAFRQTAKALNPEVYLVGEIWQRSPGWVQGDGFDALMNYAIGQNVIERFATGLLAAGAAAQEMAQLYAEYPEASVAMKFNLISSHDTGRLLTKMGGGPLGSTPGAEALARQQMASALLYALPGVPVTFQGDECAFLGTGEGPREENRYPLQWQACDLDMVAHYRRLATLRRELDALRSPVIRTPTGAGPLLWFLRGEPGPGEVLVVFNGSPAADALPLPPGTWLDAVSGQALSGRAEVGAHAWRYLSRQ
jgi:cyclomaltodextrinase / maltogenic alpha-amylase / neopullulanase